MAKKRVLVGYGIDVDAMSGWINTKDGSKQNPANVSLGVYGATVGLDRVLKLLDTHNIRASFFIPAHTIQSFPEQMKKVKDAGHEIGLHGYTHENPSELSEKQQRDVLEKSISVITEFTGKKPRGYTAPLVEPSKQHIQLLEEYSIKYDHSLMHHDVQPYFAPNGRENWIETDFSKEADHWMQPMTAIKPSKVVEISVNWHIDDWPPLQPMIGVPGHGYVDPRVVEKIWRDHFDFAYREYDTFIFPMSIHPQVSGRPHVILMHERLIEYINSHEGVEWMAFEDMAREFKEGRFPGVTVEGGV